MKFKAYAEGKWQVPIIFLQNWETKSW
jgi:hypothetical protein